MVAPMAKIRTNIFLDSDQKQKLETLSKKTGASVAELVRRAINDYLARRSK